MCAIERGRGTLRAGEKQHADRRERERKKERARDREKVESEECAVLSRHSTTASIMPGAPLFTCESLFDTVSH